MPSEEEISKAIAEMRKQGLSDDDIRETLADMGVPDDLITRILGGRPASPPSPEGASSSLSPQPHADEQSSQPPVASARATAAENVRSPARGGVDDSDDLFSPQPVERDVVSSLLSSGDSQQGGGDADSAATHPGSGSAPTVEPIHVESKPLSPPPLVQQPVEEPSTRAAGVAGTPAASGAVSPDDVAEIKEMLHELRRELKDQRALLSALQKILQEILDTDRSLLVGLYEKAKK